MDFAQLSALIDDSENRKQISCLALTDAFLDRIERLQPRLNAFITVMSDEARSDAEWVDQQRAAGRRLPLDGMPIVLKDNIAVAHHATTNGSRVFANSRPTDDAEVVRRLKTAGAVVLGKAHLHELAWGVTSDSAYGFCRNPWDLNRIPGGSSGGSAAAIAADLCVGALGTDTGGSIRLPASLTGVFGLRPSVGAISMRGVYPLAQTFDTVGPMARSARDAALIFQFARGYDPSDPWSRVLRESVDRLTMSLSGLKIGVARRYFFEEASIEVQDVLKGALDTLGDLGAVIRDIDVVDAKRAHEVYSRMVRVEALANYHPLLSEPSTQIGLDIRTQLRSGIDVTAIDYVGMRKFMKSWCRSLERIFDEVDIIATPATLITAPLRDDVMHLEVLESLTKTTRPWSLACLPAASLPCGFSPDGLPVGLQLTAQPWSEDILFMIALAYQDVTDWHRRRSQVDGMS